MPRNPVLRWIVIVLGGLSVVALLSLGGLVYLVSRLDAREIARAVQQATGRELVIRGESGVSLFPFIGLEAEDAALANVQGGRAPALMAVDEINIGVEILPLFRREMVVRALVMQRPRIALEVDAEGQPNWLLAPQRSTDAPSIDLPEIDVAPQTLRLRRVRISDGEFSFYDARRGVGWVFGDADLDTALHGLDQPVQVGGAIRYNDRPVSLQIEMAAPGAAMRGELTQISIQLDADLLTVRFAGQTVAASGEVAGNVRAEGPSLRELAGWVGAPIQGGAGLGRFAVDGHLAVGGGAYDFRNASFTVDAVSGRGDFALSEARSKPYMSGRLELFDFDLNPYLSGALPPPAESAATARGDVAPAPPPATPAPRAIDVQRGALSDTPIDFSGLRALNADLELTTHALIFQQMRLDRSSMGVVLHDGYLAATLHSAALYGGSARGRIEFDARTPEVRIVQDIALSGVAVQPLLSDAVNFGNVSGRGDLAYVIETRGGTQRDLIANARGRAHMEVVSGALRGVDLGGVAQTIRTALRGELIAPEAETAFHGFSATFAIANGALASENLSFNTPDLRIPGIGVIDLVRNRLDVRLAPRSPRGGVVVPFAIRGPLGELSYSSDIRDRAQRDIIVRVREVTSSVANQ